MGLDSRTRLGPYEIQSPLGAGGMGEVYRARDIRLNRDVAIKVLPTEFTQDPERSRRFQQEAQAVAALNHPNILAIYDFGEHDGSPYIVSELLEGESLRSRLAAGAMTARKATDVGEQIARGLAAAHQKGVTHRDLKPENIFISRDGRVKILDFGLAKLTPEIRPPDAATLASQTKPGVVMGTVGYMSPEQVRGHSADHRSDLFSFGTVLYEMLSGKRAFEGDSSVEIMNAILKQDPAENSLPSQIPPALERIVAHCLEKNPSERFQSADDVAFALTALSGSSTSSTAAIQIESSRPWWPRLRLALEWTLLAAVITLSWLLTRHTSELPRFAMMAAVPPPPGDGFLANLTLPAAISPDGRFLAMIAMRNGQTQLWIRRHDSAEAQPIAGSEDATNPFWSPDSHYIGFFAGGKLKKVDVTGGSVTDLCRAGIYSMGGAWSSRGFIIFSSVGAALERVSDAGGTPEPIPGVPLSKDALGQYWPFFLPDGKHFFYLEWGFPGVSGHENAVFVGSMDGEKTIRLPLSFTNVQYSSGYLLFSRGGDVFAQPFDVDRLQLHGTARPVAQHVQYDTFVDESSLTVSNNGILVYGTAGTGINSELTWMDRSGRVLGVLGDPEQFEMLAISPEGKRVATSIKRSDAPENIWIYDVDRGTRVLLEPEGKGVPWGPRWSADGKLVAYRTTEGKTSVINVHAADGSGEQKQIGARDEGVITVGDWSPDGRFFGITVGNFSGERNWQETLQVRSAKDESKPVLEIKNAVFEKFSPDGHWFSYFNNDTGQIYVTSFPGPGARIAVSSKGGSNVRWRGDGQELFYISDDQTLISTQLRETQGEFRVLSSAPLFRLQLPAQGSYDVTRDGKRFLANIRTHKEQSAPLTVITNWLALVQGESK